MLCNNVKDWSKENKKDNEVKQGKINCLELQENLHRLLSMKNNKPGIPGMIKFGSFRTSRSVLFSFTLTHLEEVPPEGN